MNYSSACWDILWRTPHNDSFIHSKHFNNSVEFIQCRVYSHFDSKYLWPFIHSRFELKVRFELTLGPKAASCRHAEGGGVEGGWTQWVHSLWHSLPAHWFCQPFLATAVNINSECLCDSFVRLQRFMKIEVFVSLSPPCTILALLPLLQARRCLRCSIFYAKQATPPPCLRQSSLQALLTSLDLAPGRSCACYGSFSSVQLLLLASASADLHWFRFLPCFHFIFVRSAPPPVPYCLLMWLISTLPLRFWPFTFSVCVSFLCTERIVSCLS